jgi:predicted Zn finger-like uncharacterized protein
VVHQSSGISLKRFRLSGIILPNNGGEQGMKPIKLVFVNKPHKGKIGTLQLDGDTLSLHNPSDQPLFSFHRDEALLRIQFPSFFTTRYIVIKDDSGDPVCFEAKPKAIEKLQNMLEQFKKDGKGRGMANVMHQSGKRDLLIGFGSLILGVVVSVISYSMAAPGGTYVVMTGFIGVGLVEIFRGISHLSHSDKVRRTASRQESESEFETVAKPVTTEEYLTLTCTACQAAFRVKEEHAGRRVKCPTCQTTLMVPGEVEEDEEEEKLPVAEDRDEISLVKYFVAGGVALVLLIIVVFLWTLTDNSPRIVAPELPKKRFAPQ